MVSTSRKRGNDPGREIWREEGRRGGNQDGKEVYLWGPGGQVTNVVTNWHNKSNYKKKKNWFVIRQEFKERVLTH